MEKKYTLLNTGFLRILVFAWLIAGSFSLKGQNTNLPVGAIEGNADVSLNGIASYSIPIKVVPGTKNVQPNLAIAYNSAGGSGLLGVKWDLAGISSISRISPSIYHDRGVRDVNLDVLDRFAWDGNRLIENRNGVPVANETVYGTEMETFAKITSYGTAGTGPEYFKVVTQDGTIIEYGNNLNSRQMLGANVLTWFINKITDPDGNYMTFSYLNEAGKSVCISSISYTGNSLAGLTPYASVHFNYINNTIEDNDLYIGGQKLKQNKLLNSIDVKYNTTLVKKYEFIYDQTGKTHLTQIKYFGENNTEINPTTITWGTPPTTFTEQPVSIESDSSIVIGDFNGDGISDYVLYDLYKQNGTAKWELYQGTGDGSFTFICGGTHKESPMACTVMDVEGDGKNELVFGENHSGTREYYYISFENGSSHRVDIHSGPESIYAQFGDFNGDGKGDAVFFDTNSDYRVSFWGLTPTDSFFYLGSPVQIIPIHHMGNSKSNIQTLWSRPGMSKPTVSIYEYSDNSSPSVNAFYSGEFPTDWEEVYYGDFNGDGKQDILTYDNGTWQIYMATGKGYSPDPIPALSLVHHIIGCQNSAPLIVDINGDGKDDIIQFLTIISSAPSMIRNTLTAYISKGISNGEFKYTVEEYVLPNSYYAPAIKSYFGDFNGDGKTDILCKVPGNPDARILYMFKDEQYNLVQKITDGMGVETEWSYALPSSSFLSFEDVNRKRVGWPLVKTMRSSNGVGIGKNSVTYRYTNVFFDDVRRQFTGFEKVYISHDGLTSRYDFTFNSTTRNMSLYKTVNYRDTSPADLIGEEINQYRYMDFGYKRFFTYKSSSETKKYLDGTRSKVSTTLRNDGYPQSQIIEHYDALTGGNKVTSETISYNYRTVQLSNGVQVLRPYSTTNTASMFGSIHSMSTVTKYDYDSNGRLSATRFSSTAFPDYGSITSIDSYNALGLPLSQSITDGNQTRTETCVYDNTGRFVIEHFNPLNQKTTRTYDGKTGNLLTETDINELTTEFFYDNLGREASVKYPDNTRDYNLLSWVNAGTMGNYIPNVRFVSEFTRTGFSPVRTYYDMLGREVCHEENGSFSDTRYNEKGQVARTSLPYTPIQKPDLSKTWNATYYDEYGRVSIENGPEKSLVYTYTPGKVSVRDGVRHITSSKTYDAAGRLIFASDTGGVIAYEYIYEMYDGQVMEENRVHNNGATVSYFIDFKGDRVSLTDPNAGTMRWHYNLFGEVIHQQSANGISVDIQYDLLGRVTEKNYIKNGNATQVNYEYDLFAPYNRGKGKLTCVRKNGELDERYNYDAQGRLFQNEKFIDGYSFVHTYIYNADGLIEQIGYPDHFKINYTYNNGELYEIRRGDNNALIYGIHERNDYRQPVKSLYGNNLTRACSYDYAGRITQIRTTRDEQYCLQQIDYDYNRGLITSRYRQTPVTGQSQREFFTYDPLDRLRSHRVTYTSPERFFIYDQSGNITSHPHIGNYTYGQGNNLPHAVTKIELNDEGSLRIPSEELCVSYNEFNRPATISEGEYSYNLFYGAEGQRVHSILYKNGNPHLSKYYVSDLYEIIQDSVGNYRHLNYIYADNNVVAILDKADAFQPGTMYYVHTDHLESYSLITDTDQNVVERYHFDAWGNRKQYENWEEADTRTNFLFDRGFCGHEHLDVFGIINMNARLYDPVIGRFFSPDPFIQAPDFTQSFNRYSYCWNNPLIYTDPSGEFIFSLFLPGVGTILDAMCWGALINGVIEGVSAGIQGTNVWAGIGKGVLVGAIGGLFTPIGGGIWVKAGVEMLGSAIEGGLDAALSGGNWKDVVIGATIGVVTAGIIGGVGMMTQKTAKNIDKIADFSLDDKGYKHIVERHFSNTSETNVSKFSTTTDRSSLNDMINTTIKNGQVRKNTQNRPGNIIEYHFDKKIGVNSYGENVSGLRVIIEEKNNVITAFPIKY